MNRPFGIILGFVLALIHTPCLSAPPTRPQAVFDKARSCYQRAQYDSTIRIVKAFLKENGRDASTEYLVPLLMEALVRRGDSDYSQKLLAIYLRKFPESPFVPRLRYLEGIVKARQEYYVDAVVAFSQALTGGVTAQLDTPIVSMVRSLCEKTLAAEELSTLSSRTDLHPRILEMVRYGQTLRLYQAGHATRAEQTAQEFSREYGRASSLTSSVKDLQARAEDDGKTAVPVGLLAPVSGFDADIGRKIVQGVQLAVDKYNKTATRRVKLIICDTRGNLVQAAQKSLELLRDYRVSAIVGPVLSQDAVVTASMLVDKDVLMISPTATDDGIADLGPTIFQMNVTTGFLGRKIASYAMSNLNIRDVAIVAPTSDYGRILSDAFKEEFRKNGGRIVAEEAFDEGANDFKEQFQSLRGKLIRYKREKDAADGVAGYENSLHSAREDSITYADSVLSVGGLFIPAETDDVVMLAPQIPFYKIRAQVLGATGWHTAKTILDGKRYVNDAIIVTNFETDQNDKLWQDFAMRYKEQYNIEPDRVAALGYDAAELVCAALSRAGSSASGRELAKEMLSVENYRGVSGLITFDRVRRVNREAAIVKISDRKFIRVQ